MSAHACRIDENLPFKPVHVAVLTISDTRDAESDTSGALLADLIAGDGHRIAARALVRDDVGSIRARVEAWLGDANVDVIVTTGGTGLTGRDVTPEALRPLFDKEIEGFAVVWHGSGQDGSVRVVLDGWISNDGEVREALAARGVTPETRSHAELVANALAVWGETCFERLDGAFAVAATRGQELVLARDAIGERLLYYTVVDGALLFASEVKAFLAHPGFVVEPDRRSLLSLAPG